MMDVAGIRECIGAKRFVWIDDDFNDTPARLGNLMFERLEMAQRCGDAAIIEILEAAAADPDAAREDLIQYLAEVGPEAFGRIKRQCLEAQAGDGTTRPDLDETVIEAVCHLLEIRSEDRHPFEEATRAIDKLHQDEVCYIVDLKDVGSDERRGLEVLRHLAHVKAKGLAFILTNEASSDEEAETEEDLARDLARDGDPSDVPICVIAKDRLHSSGPDGLPEQLKIALKRAGLRKGMHEVLRIAKTHVSAELDKAARQLLAIPPETLDAFAIERAYKEGLSELHVVERALTSHISRSLRHLFGTDPQVRNQAEIMRRLHNDVALTADVWRPNAHLEQFLQAEIFENEELINAGLAPLASGDVFETESVAGQGTRPPKQRFLLLGQACDIAIRAEQDRDQETAFLIPVRSSAIGAEQKAKEHSLPFAIGGEVWICSLRNATMARLAVLDLASFRADGRVRVDAGHEAHPGLLAGQRRIYARRTGPADRALALVAKEAKRGTAVGSAQPLDLDLQLTLVRKSPFNQICFGAVIDGQGETPAHVDWHLRRVGRLQMPFATALLEALTSVMNRRAFDIDFARPKPEKGEAEAAKPGSVRPGVVLAEPGKPSLAPLAGDPAARDVKETIKNAEERNDAPKSPDR